MFNCINQRKEMSKQLSSSQKEVLRKSIQKQSLPNGHFLLYCIVVKESNTGFFSNERLLLLHSSERSIQYYSKLMEGLPGTNGQVTAGKGKVFVDQVAAFKCERIKGKTSTFVIEWLEGKNKVSWVYNMATNKMMHEWIAAVNNLLKGSDHNDPIFNPTVGQKSLKNEALPGNDKGNPINQKINNIPNATGVSYNPQVINPQGMNPQTMNPQTMPPQMMNPQTMLPQAMNPQAMSPKVMTPQVKISPPPNQIGSETQEEKFGDVSEELRVLRKQRPDKFNLTNDLSKKKLQEEPPRQNPQHLTFSSEEGENLDNFNTKPNNEYLGASQTFTKKRDLEAPAHQIEREGQQFSQPGLQPVSRARGDPDAYDEGAYMQTSAQHMSPPSYYDNLKGSELQSYRQEEWDCRQDKIGRAQSQEQQRFMGKGPPRIRSEYINPADVESQQGAELAQSRPREQVAQSRPREQVAQSRPREQVDQSRPREQVGQRAKDRMWKIAVEKWNQSWCRHPQEDLLEIHEKFVQHCQQLCQSIIDEIPLPKAQRQFLPLGYQSPHYKYQQDGILLGMHYFGTEEASYSSAVEENGSKEKAPVLFDQESYQEAKREFHNYNLVLGATGNKGLIKVPLSCLVEYKGILVFCRAALPENFEKVHPQQYEPQIEELEEKMRLRLIFNSIGLFRHPQGKYLLLWDLDELIPRIPCQTTPPVYFRKELLLENDLMIDNQRSLNELYRGKLLGENLPDFLQKMDTLETWVISSGDLLKSLHRSGLAMGNISELYSKTSFTYLRRVLSSEMVREVFSAVLRSELNYMYQTFPVEEQASMSVISRIVMDCAHIMINEFFSYSAKSESIWKTVVREVNRRYGVVVGKEDMIPGYLLGGIMEGNGIDCFFKSPKFTRDKDFFIRESTIPRELLVSFLPRVTRYDLETVSGTYGRVHSIVLSEPDPDNLEDLVELLGLRTGKIPSFCAPLKEEIRMYLCNFVALGEHQEFEHMGVYDLLELEPHTFCSMKASLLAIKWAVKSKNEELANKIFEIKFEENIFWTAEFNPSISEFYDFFSIFNASIGNFQESVKLAKSSLINSIKLLGHDALPTADKHYQLGNIFFKIGKKEEALKEYLRTKHILEAHSQKTIPEYGVILLKLTLLYLNFGRIGDCVGHGLEALKIFDVNGGSEQDEIETFEILARAYEITRKNGDMMSVGVLCMQKFNQTEDPKTFEKMVRIVLLPKLTSLSPQDAKGLLKIFVQLEELDSPLSYAESFSFLHNKAQRMVVMKQVMGYIDNIYDLAQEVARRDLFRSHKSLSSGGSEASQMIVFFQALATLIGYGFIIGCLRQTYYG